MLTAALFLIIVKVTSAVYVYTGYPYMLGPLTVDHVTITELYYSSPEHMTVYFPVHNGSYVPLIFISGFDGFLYSEMYSNVLTRLSSHGYIVVGINLGYPASSVGGATDSTNGRLSNHKLTEEPKRVYKAIEWLELNLNRKVLNSLGHAHVVPVWSALGALTHSSGAGTIYKAIEGNSSFIKAAIFLEPFIVSPSPLPDHTPPPPMVSYGTQLAEEFPQCITPNNDFRVLYEVLKCPRIEINVTGYGHCDILDEDFWEVCHLSHFCKTVKANDRVFYRTFVAGMMSSFFGAYLQGNKELLQYISEAHKIPVELGILKTNLECQGHVLM